MGEKKRLYRRLGVCEYWLFDATGKRIKERLRGYRLRRGTGSRAHLVTYRLVPENRWGRRESEVLRLELCVREGELRFYDPSSEEFLRTVTELDARARQADAERAARQAAEQLLEREQAERQAADKRIAELQAQLRALGQAD